MRFRALHDQLLRAKLAKNQRQRKRQGLLAIRQAAEDLGNTPAVCYVHKAVVTAFEDGMLERLSLSLSGSRASPRPERLVAKVVAEHEL